MPWLARFMPLAQASQLFVCIYLALLTSGTLVLSRVGLGVCLWALAAHVSLRHSVVARTIASSVSALLIYFCHLFPLGVFALVIGTWELGCLLQEGISVRRTLIRATAALLPLVLPAILLLKSSTGELSNGIDFGLFEVVRRLKLSISAFAVGDPVSDRVLLASLSAALGLAIWRGCRPECRLILIALPFVFLFVPFYAFASSGIIERCAIAFAFVVIALVEMRDIYLRLLQAVTAALLLVFLFRISVIAEDWRAASRIIQSYRATFATMERGSVLFQFQQDVSYPSPLIVAKRWNPPLDKIIALATLDDVLVPQLYLKKGQQPVMYSEQNAELEAFQNESDLRSDPTLADDRLLRAWIARLKERFPNLHKRFTAVYVAVFDPEQRLRESVPGAQIIATLPEHRLYKLQTDQDR